MQHKVLKSLVYHISRIGSSLFLLDETMVLEVCGVQIQASNYTVLAEYQISVCIHYILLKLWLVLFCAFFVGVCKGSGCVYVCVHVCIHEHY